MTGLSSEQNAIHNTFNKWISAFKAHNIPKMVLLLTDDVKISSITFGTYKGKDGASEYWKELFNAFPDIEVDTVTIATDKKESRIISEIDIRGTQKGKVDGSPPVGKKFHIRGAFVYEFVKKQNKIKEIRMYYDSNILKRQLEILKI